MTISYQIILGRETTAGNYILLKYVGYGLINFAGLHMTIKELKTPIISVNLLELLIRK